MTNEQNIFTEQDNAQTPAPKTEGDSLLTALVGEKQKYRSVEDLAKAYVHADTFIEQLKEENKKLKEEVTKAKTVDEALQQLQQQQQVSVNTKSESMSADDIAAIVQQQISGLETAKTREANLLQADKLMKEKFGDKAMEVFNNAAIGPKRQVLMELAATDPNMFVALFNQQTPQIAAPDVASVSQVPQSFSRNEWGKEWVADVRKNNPTRYYSTEFQIELQKKVIANPSSYFRQGELNVRY